MSSHEARTSHKLGNPITPPRKADNNKKAMEGNEKPYSPWLVLALPVGAAAIGALVILVMWMIA